MPRRRNDARGNGLIGDGRALWSDGPCGPSRLRLMDRKREAIGPDCVDANMAGETPSPVPDCRPQRRDHSALNLRNLAASIYHQGSVPQGHVRADRNLAAGTRGQCRW